MTAPGYDEPAPRPTGQGAGKRNRGMKRAMVIAFVGLVLVGLGVLLMEIWLMSQPYHSGPPS